MYTIHSFFYDSKDNGLHGLKLSKRQAITMEKIWNGPFDVIPYEVYWRKIARYMITHAPQGYIAYKDVSHWIIGNCGRIIGKKQKGDGNGVNIIQFNRDKTFTYQWYSENETHNDDENDPVYDLVFTAWDWRLEGQGDEDMFKLNITKCDFIIKNIEWTEKMHAEMEKKLPSTKHWK